MQTNGFLSPLRRAVIAGFSAALSLFAATAVRAQAEAPIMPTNLFEPAPGPANLMAVESPELGEDMKPSAGFIAYYQHRPFVTFSCDENNNCGDDITTSDVQGTIDNVESLLAADVLFSFNFLKRFSAGFGLPIMIRQTGYVPEEVYNATTGSRWLQADWTNRYYAYGVIGDIRIHLKGRILGEEGKDGFVLGAAIIPTLPMSKWTKQGKGYTGSTFFTLTAPRVMASYRYGPFRAVANLGFKARRKVEYYSAEYGHAITYGVGAAYDLAIKPDFFSIEFFAELYGEKNVVSKNFTDMESAPLMYDGGARFHIQDFSVSLAVGGGIISGIGVPQVQGLLGFNWALTTKKDPNEFAYGTEWDVDGDGIDNELDECPDAAEDIDGFQDENGCPDDDNDTDGIQDGYDSCPNEPEDKDNFRDSDGCPDLDHDEDGIKEPTDKCPDRAEDFDGFQDEDGCPDDDNDNDSIPDDKDVCPLEPEDIDEFEDDDGCIEIDNDLDGVPDTADKCPTEMENLNGNKDDDGCIDKGRALVTIENEMFVFDEPVEFRKKEEAYRNREDVGLRLALMALVLKGNTNWKLSIEAHTDSLGDAEANRSLTVKRAEDIRSQLLAAGAPADRVTVVGHGADVSLADNGTREGREQNNRVEFKINRPMKKVVVEAPDEGDAMDFTMESGNEGDAMDFTMESGTDGDTMDFSEE